MTGPLQTADCPARFKALNLGARIVLAVIASAGLGWAGAGAAADFRSVAENAAVLYDAPSAKAKKLYVVSHGYPVEVLVVVEGWSK
ncbi:MAG: hypothetical protein ACREVR_02685, partial [Burkholderiales bacterium]